MTKLGIPGIVKCAANDAPGIPSRQEYGDFSDIRTGDILPWVVQRHKARRAGPHYDVRFGPDKLYSFATKKELPAPGGRISVFQQPLHEQTYKDFEGEIPSGYGAGTVRKHDEGEIVIQKAKPGEIVFSTGHGRFPQRYALVKSRRNPKEWLLANITPRQMIDQPKLKYKSVPTEEVEKIMPPEYTITPKIDGAAAFYRVLNNKLEAYSYRTSKSGKPIIHTERLQLPRGVKLPSEYEETLLRGEIYGETPEGKAIPPQELGGILNASLANALRKQRARKIALKSQLFGVRRFKGKDKSPTEVPHSEQMRMIKEIYPHLPKGRFTLPEEATAKPEARSMISRIRSGKHPLTREGVVAFPRSGGVPRKLKFKDEHDVYIRGVVPGRGKYRGTAAGGIKYSLTPKGPVVGKVGTGFSDETRRWLAEHPEEAKGRVASIRAQGQFDSGAYRSPAFHALHEAKQR